MSHSWHDQTIMTHLKEGRQLYNALYKGNKDVVIPPPRFISCWISEVCNLDCTYCFFSKTNHDKSHTYIDADRFVQWLSQAKAAGAEALEFSGGGEPTLHPQFQEIYTRAYGMGYSLGIITHACNDMPVDDMAKKFKYVRCGLDAATTKTHDLIKRNKRTDYWFPRAVENIKNLVHARNQENPDGFNVGIKIVLNSINAHELQAMIDLARSLDVDYIQIKHEHSSDHPMPHATMDNCKKIISDEMLKNDLAVFSDGQRINRTKVLGNLNHQHATVKCFMSAIHTVVTATGKILQCCFFEDRPIGTIFQEFPDAWGSEAHRKVVAKTTIQECDKVDCRWNGYNSKMIRLIEDPKNSVSFI